MCAGVEECRLVYCLCIYCVLIIYSLYVVFVYCLSGYVYESLHRYWSLLSYPRYHSVTHTLYTLHMYIGFVVSFGGALIGSMLIYTLPALMNLKNIERFGLRPKTGLPLEVCTCDVEKCVFCTLLYCVIIYLLLLLHVWW